nr:chemotaxis protein CheA [Oceanococcus sp. HetDA_MAG_MS8]
MDQELLQDFLTESVELTESLGPSLMDLAEADGDPGAIHALFRSFHTLKGGAGFLGLDAIVNLCHVAEDLCSALRAPEVSPIPEDIDVLSESIDVLEAQMGALRAGSEIPVASEALLQSLRQASAGVAQRKSGDTADQPAAQAPAEPSAATASAQPESESAQRTPLDDDLEAILDQVHGISEAPPTQAPAAAQPPEAEQPSAAAKGSADDELDFEALLDAAHGIDSAPATSADPSDKPQPQQAAQPSPPPVLQSEPDTKPAPTLLETEAPSKPRAASATPPVAPPPVETSIRVDTKRLDAVMDLVGELVLVRNALLVQSDRSSQKAITTLDRVTADLQTAVMRIRMQPLTKMYSRLPRMVRDLARNLGKQIELELEGAETELDKNVVEALSDPMIHLVRNAVDHGIEDPEHRKAAGKPPHGTVRLRSRAQGDHVVITLQDDGAGMDPNKLRARAIERGLLTGEQAAALDTQACLQLIFAPGFSTRETISDVSGRGVGMDVVRTKIEEMGGEVNLSSEVGEGSVIELRLPLTLAILATLMVSVGRRVFSLPLSAVEDVRRLSPNSLTVLDGRQVMLVDDEPLPVFDLSLWVPSEAEHSRSHGHGIVMRSGAQRYAVIGARVMGREEVVIKALDTSLSDAVCFSGATVTGDGRIALVVDPGGLLKGGPRRPPHSMAA